MIQVGRRVGTGRPYPARAVYGVTSAPAPDVEQLFFEGLRMPNGTWKTTADHRLDDVNHEIRSHLPNREVLLIKDVAVASGISTLEWCRVLAATGVRFEMTATDRFVNASLVEIWGGLAFLMHEGVPLQFELAGRAVRPEQRNWRNRVASRLPLYILGHPRLLEALTRRQRDISLVSPRLTDVRVMEEDLLSPPSTSQWDVIRAANILNRVYFSEATLHIMLQNLISSISDGGLLVVCRTDRNTGNQASLFRVNGGCVETVAELNGGSEVADLALRIRV